MVQKFSYGFTAADTTQVQRTYSSVSPTPLRPGPCTVPTGEREAFGNAWGYDTDDRWSGASAQLWLGHKKHIYSLY